MLPHDNESYPTPGVQQILRFFRVPNTRMSVNITYPKHDFEDIFVRRARPDEQLFFFFFFSSSGGWGKIKLAQLLSQPNFFLCVFVLN